jgi:DNA-binding LytR/AlgR family response regulator
MTPLKCLIIDDEPVSRKIIREYIEDVDFLELTSEAESAVNCSKYLATHPIDLMFLDIQMPGMNGIDFLKTSEVKPLTIITTAYPDYALQGYDLDVLDYLVKPIAFERFMKAVQKAQEYHSLRNGKDDLQTEALYIKCDRRIEKILLQDILFVEATGNFITIHTKNGKFMTWMTFKGIEEKLPQESFARIHRSYIVSLPAISRIDLNKAVLPGRTLPISRYYRKQALGMINRYLLRHS